MDIKKEFVATLIPNQDAPNNNGRVYTKESKEQILNLFQKHKEKYGGVFGHMGMPRTPTVDLRNVSIITTKLAEINGRLECTFHTVGSMAFTLEDHLESLLNELGNNSLRIRPHFEGEVGKNGEVIVYELISFDLIPVQADPFIPTSMSKEETIKMLDEFETQWRKI